MKSAWMLPVRLLAAGLCVSLGTGPELAQTSAPVVPQAVPAAGPGSTGGLTVPAGTVVPLTLVSVIKAKSTPIGDTVRASVAFPVTVGNLVAIPAGVFVEGRLEQAVFPKGYKKPKGAPTVSPLKVHFTQLIYPNGYTAGLNAEISASLLPMQVGPGAGPVLAEVELPAPELTVERGQGPYAPDAYASGMLGAPPFEPPQQQQPPLTNPYAHAGPNPAVIYGPIIAAAVITTAILLAAHHHGEPLDSVLYGAGAQLSMVLSTPLLLDRSRVTKSASVDALPGGQ